MRKYFSPFTFGFEWEILILKKDLSFADARDIVEIANEIRKNVYDSQTGLDFVRERGKMLEIRSGILRNAEELTRTIEEHYKIVEEKCKEKKLLLFPSGTHPITGSAIGLHVHVGSVYDTKNAKLIADALVRYAPCFLALCVNSPFGKDRYGEFKSYRILSHADFCSFPRAVLNFDLFSASWGDDICVKTDWHSTIELRIGDSASSKRFVKEYVSFWVAFVKSFERKEKEFVKITPELYKEYVINRWRATKYGLQAVFLWKGKEIAVTEILKKLIDETDFGIIEAEYPEMLRKMIEKKITQADWQKEIFKYLKDRFVFANNFAEIVKKGDVFEEYLTKAQKLGLVKPEPIEEYILFHIDKDTPYKKLYDLLLMPYPLLDFYLEKLIKEKKIKVKCSPEYGKRFTRC